MRRPTQGCRGFTAIELVLVLALTALVGAVAVSALHTYRVRQQVAASVVLAAPAQDHVARAFRRSGVPPGDGTEAGLPAHYSAGDYVRSVSVVDGRVDLTFGGAAARAIADRVLSLTPFETADQKIVWICGIRVPGMGLRPLGFAGGIGQAVQAATTVEKRYLPSGCR
jgi:prepilin-type N-terminal cleavage/methylation domain-containing protein